MFKKVVENFICENCGQEMIGGGFTNHCSNCLYSKHVDIDPGDRESKCLGLMKPIGIEKKGREYSIVHNCLKCGFKRINKCQKEDNFDTVLQIASENSKNF
jgi:predicted RNA-binding Zn-ribbon protein involved in translation (DUF1610 family)